MAEPPSSHSGTLLAGRLGQTAWVRVEGRGDHLLAPSFNRWARHEIDSWVREMVVDLEHCVGLDSTFLGTLAAEVVACEDNAVALELVRADERVHRILDRMGMSQLTSVRRDLGEHEAQLPDLEVAWAEYQDQTQLSRPERLRFALEAHRELQKTSAENRLRFADVIDLMEEDLRQEEGDG